MIEKLKIISSARIISFELHSQERAVKLAQDIKRDGKLKNPLLVYPLDGKYLMLDDASILMALKLLGAIHVPVQLAEIDSVSVHPWQRVVDNMTRKDLLEFCSKFPRQIRVEKQITAELASNQVEVRFSDRSALRLTFASKSYLTRVDVCCKFFNHLTQHHNSFRAKLNYHDPSSLDGFTNASAAVFPPAFSLPELAGMALRNIYLPQGMVRIDQPNRVLGIDYLLSILGENVPANEKELFLKQLLKMRMSSDRVAYYNGGVFMFNN